MKKRTPALSKLLFVTVFTITALLSTMTAFAVTREDAMDYVDSKMGTSVGNSQCVAFAKDYYKTVFGEKVHGYGRDYINNVPDGWTQMLYGEEDWDPQPGDVVCWTWNKWAKNNGHVGVITKINKNGFTYADQSPEPYYYPVEENKFTYGDKNWTLAGVVRPPFEEDAADDDMPVEETTATEDTSQETVSVSASVGAGVLDAINEINNAVANVSISIEDGQSYCIVSASNNKNVNVYVNKISQIQNGTTINLYSASGDATQSFTFKNTGDNTWLIQPKGSKFTLNVSSRKTGADVLCWKNTSKNNEEWIAEASGDGYTLRLENAPSLYLTQSGSALTLQKKSGKNNQIFKIQ